MSKIYNLNTISRIIFLLITPVFFQFFALGFIWHSIYWGVITAVVMIWAVFILISPLFGRIGCGWFCFMGTIMDLSAPLSTAKRPYIPATPKKARIWVRLLLLIPFFTSALIFYFINTKSGTAHNFSIMPSFLQLDFTAHYQLVWIIDVSAAIIMGLLKIDGPVGIFALWEQCVRQVQNSPALFLL